MTVEQLDDIPLSERQRLLHAVSTLITSLDWDWIVDARLWIEPYQTTSLAWLYPNVGIANTSGAELHESLRSLNKELTHIAKTHYSAFFENDLDEQLRARGIDDVYICGIHTNYCVASTAMASFERRYHTFVVGDALMHVRAQVATKLTMSGSLVLSDTLGQVQSLPFKIYFSCCCCFVT